jgi:RNA polymerase sigma-70 factor (ECF subfamily)
VTSALKRARAALERHQRSSGQRAPAPPPNSAAEQQLVDRLTRAFETADVAGIVAMLTEDAWLTTPPLPLEYQGRELAARFLTATALRPGWTARLLPTRANGQPAFGFYARDPQTGGFYTVGLMVLTLSGTQVGAMTRFDAASCPGSRSRHPRKLSAPAEGRAAARQHAPTHQRERHDDLVS